MDQTVTQNYNVDGPQIYLPRTNEVVKILPDTSPGNNQEGGLARVLSVDLERRTFRVKYTVGRRTADVPAKYVRTHRVGEFCNARKENCVRQHNISQRESADTSSGKPSPFTDSPTVPNGPATKPPPTSPTEGNSSNPPPPKTMSCEEQVHLLTQMFRGNSTEDALGLALAAVKVEGVGLRAVERFTGISKSMICRKRKQRQKPRMSLKDQVRLLNVKFGTKKKNRG